MDERIQLVKQLQDTVDRSTERRLLWALEIVMCEVRGLDDGTVSRTVQLYQQHRKNQPRRAK